MGASAAGGWTYQDGFDGPPTSGRVVSECYPYPTLVGVAELGYHQDGQRPHYKRKPSRLPAAQWRPERAANCNEIVRWLLALEPVDPPLRPPSHQVIATCERPRQKRTGSTSIARTSSTP